MRCRYISYTISIVIIHLTCWYFVMAFCSVYINSNTGWLYGALISFVLETLVIWPAISLLKASFRFLIRKYPKK